MRKRQWMLYILGAALMTLHAAEVPAADTVFKVFGVRSAIVNYELNGSKPLTKESNLSIRGNAALLFDEWGIHKLYKEKYTELTEGPVGSSKVVRTLYRNDHGDLYRVNFEKGKIEKSEDKETKEAISNHKNLYLEQRSRIEREGKWLGYLKIAGVVCHHWQYQGKELCLYRGVPLREEIVISGVKVIKQAISAEFDLNVTEDAFAFPDLRKEARKGFLLQEAGVTPAQAEAEKRSTGSPAAEKARADEEDQAQKEVLFREQKELFPKLLEVMKETRVCLDGAEYVEVANECLTKLLDLEEKMGSVSGEESKITSWSDSTRDRVLDELDKGILDMRRKMPCIRRSQKFEDLATCIKDPEKNPL